MASFHQICVEYCLKRTYVLRNSIMASPKTMETDNDLNNLLKGIEDMEINEEVAVVDTKEEGAEVAAGGESDVQVSSKILEAFHKYVVFCSYLNFSFVSV